MYAGLMQCSKPVRGVADRAEPEGARPSPRRRTAAARRACSATRASARACCSAVTPATPEKSIGAAGSHARGQAAGSTAAWSCPAGSPAAVVGVVVRPVGGRRAVGRALVVGVPGVVASPVPCSAVRPRRRSVGVDVRRRVSIAATLTSRDQGPGHDEADARRRPPAAGDDHTPPGEADGGEHGAHGVGELRRLGLLEPVDPRDPRRAGQHPAADGDGADDERRPRRRAAARSARAPAGDDLHRAQQHEDAGQRGARRGCRRRRGGWRRRRPTPVRRPGRGPASCSPIPVDRSSSPSIPMARAYARQKRRRPSLPEGGDALAVVGGRHRLARAAGGPRRATAPTSWRQQVVVELALRHPQRLRRRPPSPASRRTRGRRRASPHRRRGPRSTGPTRRSRRR